MITNIFEFVFTSTVYPTLSKVAREYLSIFGTNVPMERVFS